MYYDIKFFEFFTKHKNWSHEINGNGLELILIAGQLRLSYKINNQNLSKEKGYFIIKKTNWLAPEGHLDRFTNKYDITRGIPLYVAGNDDIIVIGVEIIVDGRTVQSMSTPRETYFTRDERFGTFILDSFFNKIDYENEYLNINVNMKLKNTSNYSYTQNMIMQFDKEENPTPGSAEEINYIKSDDMWILSKFNISFK